MNILSFKKHLVVGLIMLGAVIAISPVLASAYEQVANLSNACFTAPCNNGEAAWATWDTTTNGSYDEYRSFYYVMYASSTSDVPNDKTGWHEVTECRIHNVVTGSAADDCSYTIPTYPGTAGGSYRLYIRATTNFAGCGTWTPFPDVANCGDVQQMQITVYQP